MKKTRPDASGHHPIVRFILSEPAMQKLALERVAKKAGLGVNIFQEWRVGSIPNINNADAALNAMGYHLAIVDEDGEIVDFDNVV